MATDGPPSHSATGLLVTVTRAPHVDADAQLQLLLENSKSKRGITMSKKLRITVKTLNIGTPRPATIAVLNIKQFNFTTK